MCNFPESLTVCWAVLVNLSLNILQSALMECSFSLMLTYCGKSTYFLVIRLHHLAAGVAQTLRERSHCVEITYLECGTGSGHNWTVSWTHPGISLPRVLTAAPSAGLRLPEMLFCSFHAIYLPVGVRDHSSSCAIKCYWLSPLYPKQLQNTQSKCCPTWPSPHQ